MLAEGQRSALAAPSSASHSKPASIQWEAMGKSALGLHTRCPSSLFFSLNWGVLYLLPCFSPNFSYSLLHWPQTVGIHNCKIHKGENTLVWSKLWHLKSNVTGYVIHKVTINAITLNKCALKQLLQLL